ncbi:hypothetical protein [Microbispora sp. H10885]|uniref:hypothetical protein n=1 Tax=Microbispora sp. H10885 TaxID=2729110 RepID=UPI001C718CC5|nr:hypothetical protein [Microbispora sp. H10885]
MTRWFRAYWDEEDTWFYVEVGDDGWVVRQIELRGPDDTPLTAASWPEWQEAEIAGRLWQYEAAFGATAEIPLREWDGYEPQPLTSAEFESSWRRARYVLGGGGRPVGGRLRPRPGAPP